MKRKSHVFIMAALIGILIGSVIGIMATAEDRLTEAWVLCQPDSWINIRAKANSHSQNEGMLISGDRIWVDGQTKNGFAHCDNMTTEAGEGWVHAGYIVFEEPKVVNRICQIDSNGRVACRRTIDGDRRCWVVDGSEVYVYMASGEWSVTDKGFIQTKYIDLEDET